MSAAAHLPTVEPVTPTDPEPSNSLEGKKPRAKRDPWPDNVRILAGVLICSIHFTGPFRDAGDPWSLLWYLTWGARVPVFVIIAGYFSHAEFSKKLFASLIRNVLGAFVIFTLIQSLIVWISDGATEVRILDPFMGLWFMLALIVWRVTLPLIVKVPGYFFWSLLVAVGFGFADSLIEVWPFTRTFSYLPMFLVGYMLSNRPNFKAVVKSRKVLLASVFFLAVSSVVIFFTHADFHRKHFVMLFAYEGTAQEQLLQAGIRLALILLAIVSGLAAMSLVPQGRIKYLTALGAGSFYVYLLHPPIYALMRELGYFEWVGQVPLRMIVTFIGSIALGFFLASKPVRKVFRPLVQPRYSIPYLSPKKKSA